VEKSYWLINDHLNNTINKMVTLLSAANSRRILFNVAYTDSYG